MAYKKKEENQKRKNIITVKLTDAELDALNAASQSAKVTKSEFIRNLIINKKMSAVYQVVLEKTELKELVREYGKIGSNLNQIAKYFNSGGENSLVIVDELHQCIHELFELRKEVLRLAGDVNGYFKTHKK